MTSINPPQVRGPARTGATIWLTGLPSAGKSTVAVASAELLRRDGHAVEIVDKPDLRLDTHLQDAELSVKAVHSLLAERGLV